MFLFGVGVNLEEDSSSTFSQLLFPLFCSSQVTLTRALVTISREGVNCLLNAASQFIDWS